MIEKSNQKALINKYKPLANSVVVDATKELKTSQNRNLDIIPETKDYERFRKQVDTTPLSRE